MPFPTVANPMYDGPAVIRNPDIPDNRQFVIGDVEPRVKWPRGDYKIETDWGDPLALDYVVGDGPREPVWREPRPIWIHQDQYVGGQRL